MLVKLILALALVLLADAADAGTRVFRASGTTMWLEDTLCTNDAALAGILPIYHDRFRNGRARTTQSTFTLCWTDRGTDGSLLDNAIYVTAEDGSDGLISLEPYTEDRGI